MKLSEFTINKGSVVLKALERINQNMRGFLIVTDDDEKVIGTLTDGDIRRALLRGLDASSAIEYNTDFTYVTRETEMSEVIDIFKDRKIKFLPVLDDDMHLKNIITKGDIHALLLQDIHPDLEYDFINVDDSIVDHEIFQRPWGFYKTTILNDTFQSKIISVKPLSSLSLQEHKKREEYWVVVKGNGQVRIGDSIKDVTSGSTIFIPKGCKHRMKNIDEKENLIFIEIQLGNYFGEDDIIRFEDEYGRV